MRRGLGQRELQGRVLSVQDEIEEALSAIEREHACAIILAVESGSRAWGFASTDSDWDVRFVYVHRPEHYLSIVERRDVIEKPITGELDVSGWDLKKALQLMRKSNPPLLEWLMSKIIYRERPELSAGLRALAPTYYSPRATFFHYLNMAKGNHREYLQGQTVWRKKYFYVLRPLLAMRWIELGLGMPPIEFDVLVERTVSDAALRAAIDALLVEKKAGKELGDGPRVPAIGDFVSAELARFESIAGQQPVNDAPTQALDECFRQTIALAWR